MTNTPQPPPKTPKAPSVHLNWQDWLPHLEDVDATDAEKRQLIETLWSIVIAFVDLGWDVAQSPKTCGENLDLTAALQAAVLYSQEAHEPESEEK